MRLMEPCGNCWGDASGDAEHKQIIITSLCLQDIMLLPIKLNLY